MTQVLDPIPARTGVLFRNFAADGPLVGMAGLHALVLLMWPNVLTVGLGMWWNANTISHYFLHRPFFRVRAFNATFSVLLSLLLGVPQSVWRDRHLAHHANVASRIRRTRQLWIETLVVATLWGVLAFVVPTFFFFAYLPGLALGLTICAVHGYYEHVGGGTISHYGWLYNFLFFGDGYHVEHHERPGADWRTLQARRHSDSVTSSRPAVLRWMDYFLDTLERLVIHRPWLQRFVIRSHRQAWLKLTPQLGEVHRVGIIGGGLFPRTALLLREVLPAAELTLIDCNGDHLAMARKRLGDSVRYEEAWFDPDVHSEFDLLVVPLAFRGDGKAAFRKQPPAPAVVFHDWLWERGSHSVVVSRRLLKRMSLHQR